MTGQLFRQLRIDAHSKKLALAIRQRLLERSLHRVCADRNFRDFALFEQRLKLTIGYGFDLRVTRPKLLKQQKAKKRGQYVPDHKLALAGVRFHKAAASSIPHLKAQAVNCPPCLK